ncbi:hypothetical protein [Endozoicomonas sp. 8E]|uniref:hypothetical protein n=1 Tax=Endozoicomonas sp. 8E TaxID=3035692 RepID=UPI0029394CF7|nr:hypothetical protein [Endozoicomonas sp. 8E]WOG27556.1 hypothetical protein P6910_23910 [Endozoicomonas sp. 8E]
MNIKYAACTMIFLSFTNLHAEEVGKETGTGLVEYGLPLNEYINHHTHHCDEVENGIIGTWLIKDDSPFNQYITYHPPYRYKDPVTFIITGYGEYYSEDILYGRYDSVVEVPERNLKVIAVSGVWFCPKDMEEKLIFDFKQKDVDIYNFKLPVNIVNPIGGLAITRVLKVDGNEFIYEEYKPENKVFDRYSAVRVPTQSLEQIKKLRYYDEL